MEITTMGLCGFGVVWVWTQVLGSRVKGLSGGRLFRILWFRVEGLGLRALGLGLRALGLGLRRGKAWG